MRIESIRQWQWMVLSIVMGAGIGYLRQQVADDLAGQFGSEITSQARFEQSVLNVEQGRHCFTDLSVHTRAMTGAEGGASKPVSIVSGLYFNGHYEPKDGKLLASWEPAFYVAPIPYRPVTDVSRLGNSAAASRFAAIRTPTVTDFLDCLASTAGIHYTHAWWQGMRPWQWMVASFVSIGVAFPILINLLVFGTWRRPAEQKALDLSKVSTPPKAAIQPATEEDIGQLIAVTENLEKELARSIATSNAEAAVNSDTTVKALASVPVAAPREIDPADVTYGSKKDDFYPTAKTAQTDSQHDR
jgi:hypothetical protein